VVRRAGDAAPGRVLVRAPGAHARPDVSPDGRRVVFQSARAGQRGTYLYVIGIDGSGERRLTFPLPECGQGDTTNDCRDSEARWAPDGRTIVFTRGFHFPGCDAAPYGCARLLVLDVDTGATRSLVRGWAADWSPDGRRLVFAAPADAADAQTCDRAVRFTCNGTVHVLTLATGEVRSLGVKGYGPRWSPDGSWLLYEADHAPDEPHQARIMRTDGTGVRDALPPGHEDSTWTPDGRVLSTVLDASGRDVWSSDPLRGSPARRTVQTTPFERFPVVVPAGRR
jgi:Tol biopolymer transport system component